MRPARSRRSSGSRPRIDLADHRVGGDLDAVELEPRGDAGIGQALGLGGQARGALVDREQRDAVRVVGRSGGARGDDDQVGDMAVRDELLLARSLKPLPERSAFSATQSRILGLLVDRQRGDGLARQDAGEILARLRACP